MRQARRLAVAAAMDESEPREHVLDGVTYVWTGTRWHNKKTFLTPPTVVLARLNELVEVPHEVIPKAIVTRPVKPGAVGAVPDVAIGAVFRIVRRCEKWVLHRPLQAGICGTGKTGAESIVLNGGYEDDVDSGDEIICTGHGGNDPATGQQVADSP